MARKRASMREGPLAELFRATEAAQRREGDDDPTGQASEAYRELAKEVLHGAETREHA